MGNTLLFVYAQVLDEIRCQAVKIPSNQTPFPFGTYVCTQIFRAICPPREKHPQFASGTRKIPLNTASDSCSLTVFLQGHFEHPVFSGCQVILIPDAATTLVF